MPYVDDDNYVIFPEKQDFKSKNRKDIFESSAEQETGLGTTINLDGKAHNIAQRLASGKRLS